jgi:hypothetical protein
MPQFLKFIYFQLTLHVSDGFSVHHQELKTVHTATGICQTDTAIWLLASRLQYLCWHIPVAVFTVFNSWWWTDRYCSLLASNKVFSTTLSCALTLPSPPWSECSACLTYTCCCMYNLELLMMDRKTIRNVYSINWNNEKMVRLVGLI